MSYIRQATHAERVSYLRKTIDEDLDDIISLTEDLDIGVTTLIIEEKVSEIKAIISQLYIGYIDDIANEMDSKHEACNKDN